eukprot:CAMPEP_0113867648 /NCGR_PEP_ID=MMETSP0780_2-20120614/536_1 /TAXON_ID=652834 /ORGANISM="Palpitomonas bilix" /LENGTH=851 /DNA_ID=CAMNT_0000852615 /DNA_START=278 /DNA_END=2833 /DNA_ORIENTATION=+ /assembly_acc=CAM_ASM_000599
MAEENGGSALDRVFSLSLDSEEPLEDDHAAVEDSLYEGGSAAGEDALPPFPLSLDDAQAGAQRGSGQPESAPQQTLSDLLPSQKQDLVNFLQLDASILLRKAYPPDMLKTVSKGGIGTVFRALKVEAKQIGEAATSDFERLWYAFRRGVNGIRGELVRVNGEVTVDWDDRIAPELKSIENKCKESHELGKKEMLDKSLPKEEAERNHRARWAALENIMENCLKAVADHFCKNDLVALSRSLYAARLRREVEKRVQHLQTNSDQLKAALQRAEILKQQRERQGGVSSTPGAPAPSAKRKREDAKDSDDDTVSLATFVKKKKVSDTGGKAKLQPSKIKKAAEKTDGEGKLAIKPAVVKTDDKEKHKKEAIGVSASNRENSDDANQSLAALQSPRLTIKKKKKPSLPTPMPETVHHTTSTSGMKGAVTQTKSSTALASVSSKLHEGVDRVGSEKKTGSKEAKKTPGLKRMAGSAPSKKRSKERRDDGDDDDGDDHPVTLPKPGEKVEKKKPAESSGIGKKKKKIKKSITSHVPSSTHSPAQSLPTSVGGVFTASAPWVPSLSLGATFGEVMSPPSFPSLPYFPYSFGSPFSSSPEEDETFHVMAAGRSLTRAEGSVSSSSHQLSTTSAAAPRVTGESAAVVQQGESGESIASQSQEDIELSPEDDSAISTETDRVMESIFPRPEHIAQKWRGGAVGEMRFLFELLASAFQSAEEVGGASCAEDMLLKHFYNVFKTLKDHLVAEKKIGGGSLITVSGVVQSLKAGWVPSRTWIFSLMGPHSQVESLRQALTAVIRVVQAVANGNCRTFYEEVYQSRWREERRRAVQAWLASSSSGSSSVDIDGCSEEDNEVIVIE